MTADRPTSRYFVESLNEDGLNHSRADDVSESELETFRAWQQQLKGRTMGYQDFWLEFRPDVFKRYRAMVRASDDTDVMPLVPHVLGTLHFYAIVGWPEGVLNQIKATQRHGATKAEILDTLAVAFIHASPMGMAAVAEAATEHLRDWEEPEDIPHWPDGWSFEPDAFDTGLDFGAPDATREEMERVRQWYRDTLGEIPPHIEYMANHAPRLLKAYRNRLEHAIRGALPKQMLPYLMLDYSIKRGWPDGAREAVLLGRAMGITREQTLNTLNWGWLYGGVTGIGLAAQAVQDILENW